MIFFVCFLSFSVAVSILWMGFIVSFLTKGALVASVGTIITMMGLFLPLVVIAMAVAFVFIALEMKKNQLVLKDWMKAIRRDILNDPQAVHEEIGHLLEEEIEKPEEAAAVMNISQSEPITKYKNLELPDDVELHFKG